MGFSPYNDFVRLITLGRFELEGSNFQRPKALLLLSYLAIEGKQTRRHVADLFWSGHENALGNLSMTLSRLRKALPNVIEADESSVWTTIQTDVQTLHKALQKQDYQQVLKLYQGAFFEAVAIRNLSNELEEWLYEVRESTADDARRAWLALAEEKARQGKFELAATYAETAYHQRYANEPDPDDLSRIYVLMQAGQNTLAKKVAKEADYYGLELNQTPEEAQHLLQERASETKAEEPKLPNRKTSFIGRDLELAQISNLLTKPEQQLISLVGVGGVGKSRVALQLAKAQQTIFEELYFVPLETVAESASLLASIAEVIGLKPEQNPLVQLVDHIADKRVLLVLDNIEHLLKAAPDLSQLVQQCSKLKLLVTSRERLNLEEETIFVLEGLNYPSEEKTESLENFAAISLFVERACQANPNFVATKENAGDIATICKYLEGSPLGIELAAIWVKSLSCKEIAEEIKINLDFLETNLRNVNDRHKSIRAVFEYSWQLLEGSEQSKLRKLSVLQGSFSKDAAKEIAGASFRDLASFIDKSLLQTSDVGKFAFHPLVHQYLSEKLSLVEDEKLATEEAHCLYFLRFIKQHKGSKTHKLRESHFNLTDNFANLHRAWVWAIEQNKVNALKESALGHGCQVYSDKNNPNLDNLTQALESMDNHTEHEAALGYALILQAEYQYVLGLNHDIARAFTKRGLSLLRPLNEYQGIIRGLLLLGIFAQMYDGDYELAKHHLSEALQLARHYDDTQLGDLLWRLCFVYRTWGDFDESLSLMRQALAEVRQCGDEHGETAVLLLLGSFLVYNDYSQEGIAYLKEALSKGKKLEHFILHGIYADLARAHYKLGYYKAAEAVLKEALPISRTPDVLGLFSRVKLKMQAFDEAEHFLKQALAVDLQAIQPLLSSLAHSLLFTGELLAAKGFHENAAEIFSLIINHPHTERRDKDDACQCLEAVRSKLSQTDYYEALERGKTLDLEASARAFLEHGFIPT